MLAVLIFVTESVIIKKFRDIYKKSFFNFAKDNSIFANFVQQHSWTKVISFHSNNSRKEIIWNCKCDCGNITQVTTHSLHSGHTRSCGCLHNPNLTNKKFGKLTVIGEAN